MATKDDFWDEYLNQGHDRRDYPERYDNTMKNDKYEEDSSLDAIIDYVMNQSTGELQSFDEFWEEVKGFADQYNLSYTYVEEEFVIDGQLVPVHLHMDDDPLA